MNIALGLIDCQIESPYATYHCPNTIKEKNKMLKELSEFDYAFIIQKGVIIKDPLIFEHYAITSDKTGHQALLSGTSEISNEKPLYDRDPYIDYWGYPGTMLMMFTKRAIAEAGLIDEEFPVDTYEDTEYYYRLCKKGMVPPFSLFPGIKGEPFYFSIDSNVMKERMTLTPEKKKLIKEAVMYWQSKDPENFPHGGKERIIGEKKLELRRSEGMV